MTSDAGPAPIWVWMDVSATCNLACRDCYTKQAHAPQILTLDAFRSILTALSSDAVSVRKLHLNWRGEPFTNPRLAEMIAARNDRLPELPIELHTNGTLLDARRAAAIVREMRPDDLLYVSIDGGRAELHEANRGGGTWEVTLDGLDELLAARAAAGGDGPRIGVYEIDYGSRRPIDARLLQLIRRCDTWTRVSPLETTGRERSFVNPSSPCGACFWAGHALCITAAGDVHVCLLSFRPDGVLGNIFADDLLTIVANARAFRERLQRDGRSSVAHCRGCQKTDGEIDES